MKAYIPLVLSLLFEFTMVILYLFQYCFEFAYVDGGLEGENLSFKYRTLYIKKTHSCTYTDNNILAFKFDTLIG